ncbi:hypothetical protein JG687_00019222, partial [Phytophthora cactorum]
VSNRVSLETHRAEEIACSRHEEKATHLAIHGKQRDREEDDDSPPGERWEIRALRHMFPASTASADSTDDGSALGEAIAALEAAGAESSPDGTDDSDFEEGKSKLPRVGTRDESGSSESAFMVKLSGDTADESMVDKRDGEEEAEVLSSGDEYDVS